MSIMRLHLIAIMILAGGLTGLAQPAFATALNMKNIPPLSEIPPIPEKEFVAQTELHKGDPNDDPLIQYEVRLPKGWALEKSSGAGGAKDVDFLSKNVLQRVARYVSPAQKHRRAMLSVESLELTYEIGARNWFLNHIRETGYTLEGMSAVDGNNGEVTAVYAMVEGDITYVVRARTFINGPRVVLVRYFVPLDLFGEQRPMQAQSLDSFKLVGKKASQIEKRHTHGFLDQAYFDYPVSWMLSAPKVINVERMRAMVYTPGAGGKLAGQVNIYLTSRYIDTTLAQEVAAYRKNFTLPDYQIGAKIENVRIPAHKDMERSQTEVYKLAPQKNFMLEYELWVTVMQSEGFYVILTMVTPSRDAEFYQWARNVKAYEIVVGTTRQFDHRIDRYKYAE